MASSALLEIQSVVKRWPGAPVPVLDGVELTVAPGGVVHIQGANGAGKTTLMRLVARVIDPDAGTITVAGRRADDDRVAYLRDLGLVTAGNTGLYARLSGVHHLQFAAKIGLVERRRRDACVTEAIARFDLADFVARRVDRLSLGQRQRLRLALGFLHGPTLVLLDEPTSSLDAAGRACLSAALERHVAHGGGAVCFGPTGEAPPLAVDQLLSLDGGRLRAA